MNSTLHQTDAFKKKLGEALRHNTVQFARARIRKHQNIYHLGDVAKGVYAIESGQIKLLTLSQGGKECLLAILTAGDMFGESCLSGSTTRQESAMAMEDTTLTHIPCASFFSHLTQNSLLEGFVHYLTARLRDQQRVIANLVTVNSEHRLGETLLDLAYKLGQPHSHHTRIEQKITHEELSEMVGTTRPRITKFMRKFRGLGLIETSAERSLIVKHKELSEYLTRII